MRLSGHRISRSFLSCRLPDWWTIGIVVVAIACGQSHPREKAVTQATPLRDVTITGRLADRDLVEASGLAPSTREPNVFWSQNDSGNEPRIFAHDSAGVALGSLRIRDANNRDWEAIASGPCESGRCLFLGDVGDNLARHAEVRIFRISEPLSTDTVTAPASVLTFSYADGAHDVEAMWVTPDSSIFLLTKRPLVDRTSQALPARLFRLAASAWSTSGPHVARLVDSLPIVPDWNDSRSWITDAALSEPDLNGQRQLAVRTNDDVYVFAVDTLLWRPGALLAHCSLRALRAKNGEGLAWLPDGRLLFHSEGRQKPVHAGRCP